MKRFTIFIILFQVFVSSYVFGEDISKSYFVRPIEVVCDYPFNDTTKWAVTCRVWGLLKYFHPNVTAGNYDWDKVLIDQIDKINGAETSEQVNAELMQMIRIAGAYEVQTDSNWNDSLNMNVNLCWLDHSFINDTITKILKEIASLTTPTNSYYLRLAEDYLPIINEKTYNLGEIDHYEYRLLALFRYWNVIYYLFPYKYLMDQSWDITLSEFIPHFLKDGGVMSYRKSVLQLATRLNDGHGLSSVMSDYDNSKFQYFTFIDSLTVVRKPPEESLLERGDIILSINGQNIKSFRDSLAALCPSSNRRYTDNAINGSIYNTIRKYCLLTVKRNHEVITILEQNKQNPRDFFSTPSYYSITPDIYYVNLQQLKSDDIPTMIESLNFGKGVIFDLRNYPLQFYHWELFCHLSDTQEHNYALSTLVDSTHLGAFFKNECVLKYPDELWQKRIRYIGKMTVLINESTMSMAETFAMDFRLFGATLVGAPTAGANGTAGGVFLPGNIRVIYSRLGFYYPDGTQTQRIGIIPDIEVYPTMADIMAGRDEALEAAIQYLNSQ